jgi:hypothetical protein
MMKDNRSLQEGQEEGIQVIAYDINIWWRCRDLDPGHCGFEFEPRESARWEYLKKTLFLINKL